MFEKLTLKISSQALYILYLLQKNNFEGYIVGGAVRDTLLNALETKLKQQETTYIRAKDYDFTTDAQPEEIQALFPENFYENMFGTVGIAHKHLVEQMGQPQIITSENYNPEKNKVIDVTSATKIHESLQTKEKSLDTQQNDTLNQPEEIYEITTFRADGHYTNHRKPDTVTWGKTLAGDLARRDFTINAMAIQISQKFLETIDFSQLTENITVDSNHYTIIDLHEGTIDLESGIIRTVGDPNKRFTEDALRMLRAIRFSVQLNMQIDTDTFEAIITHSELIQHISFERIRDEFFKMLASEFPKQAIEILDETKLLQWIIPELLEGKGVEQAGHHTTDVWTHNLDALESCPSQDVVVRFATLLHDIAKPHTYKKIDGQPTFYNHEIVGSRIAKNIAKRLRLPKTDIDRVFLLVRYHMFYYQPDHTDASIRRFMRKVGLENINDILALREGDRLGSGARKTSWRLEEMKERMISQLHQPFAITDMAINGHDLMDAFQLEPGKKIGEILNTLFETVLENPELNEKKALLKAAEKLLE